MKTKGALGWVLLIVFIFGGSAILQYKFGFMGKLPNSFKPKSVTSTTLPMPEVELEQIQSPVLDKARELRAENDKVRFLLEELRKNGIIISVFADCRIATVFLTRLLIDEDSQKIFRHFSKMGIFIYLQHLGYRIGDGCVLVNVADSSKEVAKWLAIGKK